MESSLINYIQSLAPKTEADMVDEIKTRIEDAENIKDIKKIISEVTQPYDYTQIQSDILTRFGIAYKIPDIKKLLNIKELLPK